MSYADKTVNNLRLHLRSVILQNDRLRDKLELEKKLSEKRVLDRIETWQLERELELRKPEPKGIK
jgi:hypothetical protein